MLNHPPIGVEASPAKSSLFAPRSVGVVNGPEGKEGKSSGLSSSPAPATSGFSVTPVSTPLPSGPNGFPGHVDAEAGPSRPKEIEGMGKVQGWPELDQATLKRKRKWNSMGYGSEEQVELEKRHSAIQLSLALDQASTLYPELPTAFTSYEDVVNRLLPYHVWQIHDDELDSRKGADEEVARKEGQEQEEASNLLRRVVAIHSRFWKVRRREGTQPSSVPSYIHLMRLSQAEQRDAVSNLNAQMRNLQDQRGRLDASNRRLQMILAERRRQMSLASTPQASPRPPASTPAPRPATPLFPNSTPTHAPAPSRPPNPQITPLSFTTPLTPTTASPAVRGRPRGRPRGSGRSGLREAVLTHTPSESQATATSATPATPSKVAPRIPPPSPSKSTPVKAPVPASPAKATTPAKRAPIRMSLPKKALKDLISSEIIVSDTKKPNGPGVLHGVKDDKLDVTLDIASFTVPQLHVMGRILNVDPGTLEIKGSNTRRSGANARTAGENAIMDAASKQ